MSDLWEPAGRDDLYTLQDIERIAAAPSLARSRHSMATVSLSRVVGP